MSDSASFEFYDHKPDTSAVLDEVLTGLKQRPRTISPKFFYDEHGSRLFEAITELPEYYPTRTELSVFDACLPAIADVLGTPPGELLPRLTQEPEEVPEKMRSLDPEKRAWAERVLK